MLGIVPNARGFMMVGLCLKGLAPGLTAARPVSKCLRSSIAAAPPLFRPPADPGVFYECSTHFLGNYGMQSLVEATLLIRKALAEAEAEGQVRAAEPGAAIARPRGQWQLLAALGLQRTVRGSSAGASAIAASVALHLWALP